MNNEKKEKYIRAFINMVKFLRSFILIYAIILVKYGNYERYPILEIVMGCMIGYLGIEALIIFYESIYKEDVKILEYKIELSKREIIKRDNTIKKLEEELMRLKR